MVLLELFLAFLQIGLFSIGGGYAAIPLIQEQVVDKYNWLTMTQFADITTIAEMTPGPIAVNAATFVGIQVAGIPGALISTLGVITPAMIIVTTLAYIYCKFSSLKAVHNVIGAMKPAVVAMILSAGLGLVFLSFFGSNQIPTHIDGINYVSIVIFCIGFVILRIWKVNPIWIIFGSGALGLILHLLF